MTLVDPRPLGQLLTTLAGAGAGAAGTLARPALVAELEHESAAAFGLALELEATAYELGAEGQSLSQPLAVRGLVLGQALGELHGEPARRSSCLAIAGEPMAPTKSSYLYFRDEADFIGLRHRRAGLRGGAPPRRHRRAAQLVLHPELAHVEPADLLELCR